MEPLTLEYVAKILRYERGRHRPRLGGQTGLNLATQLERKGVIRECGVRLLGTSSRASSARRSARNSRRCARASASRPPPRRSPSILRRRAPPPPHRYPVVLRTAYTLAAPGRLCHDERELTEIGANASSSPRPPGAVEKSVKGYKEIEFEVMRDSADHAITICGMENVDTVGVLTGDSSSRGPILSLNGTT